LTVLPNNGVLHFARSFHIPGEEDFAGVNADPDPKWGQPGGPSLLVENSK